MKRSPADEVVLGPGLGVHPARVGHPKPAERHPDLFPTCAHALVHRGTHEADEVGFFFAGPDGRTSSVTYGELLEMAQRFAATLIDAGCTRGDRVILCMDTGLPVVAAFFGCGLVGLAPVMMSMPLGIANLPVWLGKLNGALDTTGARVAVVDSMIAPAAQEPIDGRPGHHLFTPDTLAEARPFEPFEPAPEELAYIQFTSGTTSDQKAVSITHGALMANMGCIADALRLDGSDFAVFWLPLFHDMGLISGVQIPLLRKVPSLLMSPLSFVFNPRSWLWAVHYFRGTQSAAPNFAYHICAHRLSDEDIDGLDLSSWRKTQNGAEFIHAETLEAWQARFGPTGFEPSAMSPVYGMAECVLAATFPAWDEIPRWDTIDADRFELEGVAHPAGPDTVRTQRVVSVGRPFAGHAVRVVGPDGEPLPERHQGRIELEGPSNTIGYFGNPEATAKLLSDGWLDTGDLGYLADGRLHVYGRRKDIIIKAGRNYQPESIERATAAVEGVRAGCVAAFGMYNAEGGTEDLVVVYETRETDPMALKRMNRLVSAAVKRDVGLAPNRLVPVAARAVPKTTSGKLRRAEARRRLAAGEIESLI